MSIRAEWRLAELLGVEGDPFEMVLSSGLYVDLTGDEDAVFAGLKQSLSLEATLFDQGVTCELKDGGQNCLDCTVYVGDHPEDPCAALCRLGRDQQVMGQRFQAVRQAGARELGESVEPYTELGHLPAEYDELLTAAGL